MALSTSTGKPNAQEAARLDGICLCIPCLLNGAFATGWRPDHWSDPRIAQAACRFAATGMPVERHHTLSGGFRIGHMATFGNCLWHHRALLLPGYVTSRMTARFGPALANGSKPFHQVYGSDAELLEIQDWLLSGDGSDKYAITAE